jgi:hypothetical protein
MYSFYFKYYLILNYNLRIIKNLEECKYENANKQKFSSFK